jgi:hypothetical protein
MSFLRVIWLAGLASAFVPVAEANAPGVPVGMAADRAPSRLRLWYPAGREAVLPLADGGQLQVRSLLNIPKRLPYGGYVWNSEGVPPGRVIIRVDLGQQTLSVFRGGHEIGTTVFLYGADGKPTPSGLFPILQKAEKHRSSLYDASMPYMLRLTGDGIAIHASNVRETAATHGCIGVPLDFAALLFKQVKRGDLVSILPAKRAGRTT